MTIYYSGTSGGFYDTDSHEYPSLPGDAVEITPEERADLLAGELSGLRIAPGPGGLPTLVPPPPPSRAEQIAALTAAVQAHVDAQARLLGYDDIRSAVSYADEPAVPRYAAEGAALRAWRSLVWAACYAGLEALCEESPLPDAAAVIAALPAFAAPE